MAKQSPKGTSFNAIQETIANDQRLTRKQGKSLLDYALTQSERVEKLATQVLTPTVEIEATERDYQRLIKEQNELVDVLRTTPGAKVYSNELDAQNPYFVTVRPGRGIYEIDDPSEWYKTEPKGRLTI